MADRLNQPPSLPTELERSIFEIAARAHPISIPGLMLVAWRVKYGSSRCYTRPSWLGSSMIWIPQLAILSFPQTSCTSSNPPPHELPEISGILSACRRVENLWINTTGNGALFSLIEDLPLTQLYSNIHDLFGSRIDFSHRLFSKITHLELFDGLVFNTLDPEVWTGLAFVPHLTHICFNGSSFVDIWLHLLRTCTSLRVLVVLGLKFPTIIAGHSDERALAQDLRFVAMRTPLTYTDWTTGARTGIDYWSRAEDFVAKRRSKKIDPLQYTLE
ncbi:hypothetical protein B0H19DRAFT_1250991 [Mycena capillaripes]|nr:hypothetical protein B0H19DRAFT_1250991 [Mycena capillaripes]